MFEVNMSETYKLDIEGFVFYIWSKLVGHKALSEKCELIGNFSGNEYNCLFLFINFNSFLRRTSSPLISFIIESTYQFEVIVAFWSLYLWRGGVEMNR